MTKNIERYSNATPEQVKEWHEEDYWMKMDFNPLVMCVVIPTIIQLAAMGMMFAVMFMNSLLF
jgi:hypothetical protein